MPSAHPELWAFCDPCHRWFFVPLRPDGARPSPEDHRITCPVCVVPAGRFQSREPDGAGDAGRGAATPVHIPDATPAATPAI